MGIIELILVGLGLAMDAFAVAIGKGLAVGRPTWRQAVCVGVWFGGFQALMPLVGWALGTTVLDLIAAVDHWIAFALLVLIGANMIREAVRGNDDADAEDSTAASFAPKIMFVLAVATSIDALAVGVNFALLNVDIRLAIAIIGGVTFVVSVVGLFFGSTLGKRFRTRAQIFGGAVLIGIGCKILIEHLFFG